MKINKTRLLIASSIITGAVLTPFVTYACYQNFIKPEKPKPISQEAQKPAENKPEEIKPATEPTPVASSTPAPAPTPKPAPVTTKTKPVEQKSKPAPTGGVNSIALTGSGEQVSWTVSGYAKSGFKVVWSKTSGPTYPTRSTDEYHYLSNPSTVSDSIDGFDGPGQYYVRVCEYLGGKCGVYSNQITVTLD